MTSNSVRPKGVWVYALIATSQDEKRNACYIGQTVKPIRRFKEHFSRQRPGRASAALFAWAAKENTDIRAVILSFAIGDWRFARELEGYWLKLATDAGLETPGVSGWGNLPQSEKFPGQPDEWPFRQINEAATPLDRIISTGTIPAELFIAPSWLRAINTPKRQRTPKPRITNERRPVPTCRFSIYEHQTHQHPLNHTVASESDRNEYEWPAYLSHLVRKRYAEGISIKGLADIAMRSEREVLEHLQQFDKAIPNK